MCCVSVIRLRGAALSPNRACTSKFPFIENVVLLDKRILDVETPTQEVLASDNTRVEVDSFLKYRIVDPLKFYQTVGDIDRANDQLGYILNSAVRRVLGDADLRQIVSADREALMANIRQQVNQQADKLGVSAVDVRIRRTDLPQQISEKVFSGCRANGAREGGAFSAPRARRNRRKSGPRRTAMPLFCVPTRNAMLTRRAAPAMPNARAFLQRPSARTPDFFDFYRSMQAYTTGLKASNTRLVLSPKSAFFQYFLPPAAANTVPPAH